ncbi:unnamed protein product [Gongylonema pulchrum]|uniref:Resolvase/invertase-type recombinase catalytic domain-containing protein n=1 Tax=Gongylonema pulchrum TaxID=637853 RepID=A0A183E3C9_9BILA|nr:unnamed protein product [Gongylonema pulchrum]
MIYGSREQDRTIAYSAKQNARDEKRKEFLAYCLKQYDFILTIIDRLEFPDCREYGDIYQLLHQVSKYFFEFVEFIDLT